MKHKFRSVIASGSAICVFAVMPMCQGQNAASSSADSPTAHNAAGTAITQPAVVNFAAMEKPEAGLHTVGSDSDSAAPAGASTAPAGGASAIAASPATGSST